MKDFNSLSCTTTIRMYIVCPTKETRKTSLVSLVLPDLISVTLSFTIIFLVYYVDLRVKITLFDIKLENTNDQLFFNEVEHIYKLEI